MITESEINAVELSATKKDFYQNQNELMTTAKKLSERWDPTATNESDPGIVLLKVLTAVTDKLNYTIDKNILEAFMPSAAQEESMRKLCDMMGYSMKWYRSSSTEVAVSYIGDATISSTLTIPKFSVVSNSDGDVNFVTLNDVIISDSNKVATVECMEGQIVQCSTEDDNVISISYISDDYRYYLPEYQVAENGIFIYNVNASDKWTKVDNLNYCELGSRVWKFGYDSKKSCPYIQFPEDISSLIGDGLSIYFIRTSGANGNISAKTLSTITVPSTDEFDAYPSDSFSAINYSASVNGSNIETIDDAYYNYKKTIGTFDTLVTCRDYINKIYNLVTDAGVPIVSNVVVSDIRDDINRAITLCSFDDYGVCYVEKSLNDSGADLISNFEIILYPFKVYKGIGTIDDYTGSFKYSTLNEEEILSGIRESKSLCHKISNPAAGDIVSIKNYLQIKAKVATVDKVSTIDGASVITSIYKKLFDAFNMRKVDFGEEIPYDEILSCMESADSRIKSVSMDEPVLYTKYVTFDASGNSVEYDFASQVGTVYPGRVAYNKLALRNIMAGRIELFDYYAKFKSAFEERAYPEWAQGQTYNGVYPTASTEICTLIADCDIPVSDVSSGVTIGANEAIQFRSPNFKTTVTYPAYVNYYLKLSGTISDADRAIPATMKTLNSFMHEITGQGVGSPDRWGTWGGSSYSANSYIAYLVPNASTPDSALPFVVSETFNSQTSFDSARENYGVLWSKVSNHYVSQTQWVSGTEYYRPTITTAQGFGKMVAYIKSLQYTYTPSGGEATTANYQGLFRCIGLDLNYQIGYMVDEYHNKYQIVSQMHSSTTPLNYYYVQGSHSKTEYTKVQSGVITWGYTYDGFGQDSKVSGLTSGCEYLLKANEALYINYTQTTTSSDDEEVDVVVNKAYVGGDSSNPIYIKPNFALVPSEDKHSSGSSWTKISGYDQTWGIDGMLTLGSSEKIEIRSLDKVELVPGDGTTSVINVYWILDSDNDKRSGDMVNFFESGQSEYTLQDGEYFFYADSYKTQMTYWGSGTKISRTNTNLNLSKSVADSETAEAILDQGISAIPQVRVSVSQSNGYLVAQNYKYVTLAEDDQLLFINIAPVGGVPVSTITSTWRTLQFDTTEKTSAKYKFSGDENATSLPELKIGDGINWEVRSVLMTNMGPDSGQTLGEYDKITLKDDASATIATLEGHTISSQYVPVTIKSNNVIQATTPSVRTKVVSDSQSKLWVRPYKKESITIADGTNLNIHNFGEYQTSVKGSDLYDSTTSTNVPLDLYIATPETDTYGIMLLYYIASGTPSAADSMYFTTTNNDIVIFNNIVSGNEAWQTGRKSGTGTSADPYKYMLRKGVNVVKFPTSANLKLYSGTNRTDTTVISDLDIVQVTNSNKGIDVSTLNWQVEDSTAQTTDAAKATALLAAINAIDVNHDFYYNTPIDSSHALDINKYSWYDIDENDVKKYENLAMPSAWYDVNNMNNKFVVSELQLDQALDNSGITIARTSRL